MTIAFLPSPPSDGLSIGPLHIRAYGVLIAVGAIVAVEWAARRWRARGGDPRDVYHLAGWAIPAGIIGARAYHVATDNELYRGHWIDAFKIWDGGLGIWGGVLAGVVVGLVVARRRGLPGRVLLDVVAPTIPLAQAIGRWGNWFNQELFGRPTRLPWALHIDPAHRPAAYHAYSTFHPTFLYESLWDLVVVAIVLWAERHLHLGEGRLFGVYVAAYTFGRFFVESLRIDNAHRFFGMRLNDWTSIVVFLGAVAYLAAGARRRAPPEVVRR
ncbi:MAG: prolipoprotein diacylglyceryl transferase [Acidimicrobiia bacterium]|nr:prolipoprotein diacylglyceryl transferase [Acidimicrobiia bacterium]